MAKDITTIQISKKTREKLKTLGKKGETYDKIIERILKTLEEKNDEQNRKG